jgi:hypothetical protein
MPTAQSISHERGIEFDVYLDVEMPERSVCTKG